MGGEQEEASKGKNECNSTTLLGIEIMLVFLNFLSRFSHLFSVLTFSFNHASSI